MIPQSRRWLVGLGLYLGAVGVAAQVLMIRALTGAMGGSQWAIALCLGSWMAWIGIGSALYPLLTRWLTDARRRAMALLWILAALIAASETLMPALPRLLTGMPGLLPSFGLMSAAVIILLAPLCLVQGLLFVQGSALLGSTAGVYLWESLGSVAAGLGITYLAPYTGDGGITAAIAGTSALMAALLLPSRRRIAGYAAVALAAACGFIAPYAGQSLQWRGMEATASIPCRSGVVTVIRQEGETSLFLNGGLYAFGGQPVQGERELGVLLAMTGPDVHTLLVTGGGVGNLLRSMESLVPLLPRHIAWYEADATLAAAEQRAMPFIASHPLRSRVDIRTEDLRRAMTAAQPTPTLVWIRQGDPVTLSANRWYTEEFFREAARSLVHPHSAIAFSAGEATDYLGAAQAAYLARLGHTALAGAGPGWELHIVPLDSYLMVLRRSDTALAMTVTGDDSAATLWKALAPVHDSLRFLSLPYLEERLSESRIAPLARDIRNFTGRCNRDGLPVSAAEAQRETLRRMDPQVMPWPSWLADPPPVTKPALAALLGIAAALFVFRRRLPSTFGPLLATGAMAAAGMGAEVVILFAFETLRGSVFVAIGWMLAVFMAGMAGGTALTLRFDRVCSLAVCMAVLTLATGAAALWMTFSPDSAASPVGAGLLLAITGGASGAMFASAAGYMARLYDESRSAAWLNAADHAAAAVSAFGVGIVLIPALGITVTLWGCCTVCLCGFAATATRR